MRVYSFLKTEAVFVSENMLFRVFILFLNYVKYCCKSTRASKQLSMYPHSLFMELRINALCQEIASPHSFVDKELRPTHALVMNWESHFFTRNYDPTRADNGVMNWESHFLTRNYKPTLTVMEYTHSCAPETAAVTAVSMLITVITS